MALVGIKHAKALGGALAGAVIGAALAVRWKGGRLPDGSGWTATDPALVGRGPYIAACVLCWVLFSLYWEKAAKSAAASAKSESPASRAVHVTLVNLALMLVILPVRGIGRLLPSTVPIIGLGLAIMAFGTALAVWARVHLGRNWSGAIAIKVEHQLIRSGPYRILRHPIYTGLLLMYVGPALVTGERLAALGVAIAAIAYWRKIRLEETALNTAFGAAYDDYRRATWALIPGLF